MYRKMTTAAMAALVAVGLTFGAGACSLPKTSTASRPQPKVTSAPPLSPLQMVQAAFTQTSKANTFKVSLTMVVTIQGRKITLSGDGSGQCQPPAADIVLSGPTKVHSITVGSTVYEQVNGGKWTKTQGSGGSSLGSGNQADTLRYLERAGNVTPLGAKTVHGASATGYTATIDLNKAIAAAKGDEKTALEAMKKGLGKDTLPVQVWLDGQGRVVEFHLTVPTTIQGHQLDIDMTMTMFDYGTPVHIVAPI
ncbi:LolA-like protein [Fodinicola feengrottensis]|uniref:LppX_LprAFG lipoprotein n=1 Tax=Fodinicola feengrottensis TaxID=435914 RepID=A0ABN2IUT8_9ACTN|nr:hypothetical protein [Fodinicola feengrottensis]